jgi:DNA-directed RNA polymerase specialized sigma24 family protein
MAAMSYRVTATRWKHGWELDIDNVGVTQSRSLATAEATVRDYLALDDYDDAETAGIVITPSLDADLAAEAEAAREASRSAQMAVHAAAAKSRRAVIRLKASGLSQSEVAIVLGLSTQRVSQLIRTEQPPDRPQREQAA